MNSDKIRDRLSEIESSDSDTKGKILKVLELYEEFITLIARNKVGMVTYAAGTAAEIGVYWRSLISQIEGTSDEGTLVPQSGGEVTGESGAETEVKEAVPPLG